MAAHRVHRIARNSSDSVAQLDTQARDNAVLAVFAASNVPLTDRQVCERLGQEDLNYARPSITNLLDEGRLVEHASVTCPTTRRRVRTCAPCEGAPIPRSKVIRTFRVPADVAEGMVRIARRSGLSAEAAVIAALQAHIRAEEA
jgi:hypothetical protein